MLQFLRNLLSNTSCYDGVLQVVVAVEVEVWTDEVAAEAEEEVEDLAAVVSVVVAEAVEVVAGEVEAQ